MFDYAKARKAWMQCLGMRRQLQNDLLGKQEREVALSDELVLVEKAQCFLQKVAQDTQTQLKFRVEDLVNVALDTCFPGEYEFRLDFDVARGKTDCELVFVSKRTGKVIDPLNGAGGGVADVVSFALRVSCFVLEQGLDNVIVLDEPMKFVSKDLRDRVCEVIRNLSDRLGIQFIIVTHIDEFVDIADAVFEVKKDDDGRSHVTKRVCDEVR